MHLKVPPVPLPRSNTLYACPWEAYIGAMVAVFIATIRLRALHCCNYAGTTVLMEGFCFREPKKHNHANKTVVAA